MSGSRVRRGLRASYATVFALVLALSQTHVAAATHAVACSNATTVSRFAGQARVVTGPAGGADATISDPVLDLCTGSGDLHSADHLWTAVDGNDNLGNDIVQDGVIRCAHDPNPSGTCDGSFRAFYTWGRSHLASGCSGFTDVAPVAKNFGLQPSGTPHYKVVHTSTQWQWWIAGSLVDSVPTSSVCWTGRRAVWAGESWDAGDAIGGSSLVKDTMAALEYESTVGGTWASPGLATGASCNVNSNASVYHCVAASSNSIQIWTVH
jgi:hypothetical protein